MKLHTIIQLALILTISSFSKPKEVTVSTIGSKSLLVDIFSTIMKDIYQTAGYNLTVVKLPAKRSLIEANKGTFDGELGRSTLIEPHAPNLVRIPITITHLNIAAFSKGDRNYQISSAEHLKGLSIGGLRGIAYLNAFEDTHSVQYINSVSSLFKMLYLERLDVAIHMKLDGLATIKNLNLHKSIKVHQKTLKSIAIYHYLHKSNPKLIEDITTTIIEMQQDGRFQTLIKSAERTILESY